MRSLCLLFFIFGALLLQGQGYEIKGKIKGWKDTVVYLGNYYADKTVVKDTSRINARGEFVFKGSKALPGGIYLIVTPDKKFFEILADGSQTFSLETDTADFIKHMKIKGSQENILFYQYLTFVAAKQKIAEPLRKKLEANPPEQEKELLRKELGAVEKEVKEYKKDYAAKNPSHLLSKILKITLDVEIPETPLLPNGKKDSTFPYRYYKSHFWDMIDLSDDRLIRTPVLAQKIKFYLEKMVVQVPDSITKEADYLAGLARPGGDIFKYVVYYVTYTYETSNLMGMDAVFVHMVNQYYKTGKAFWVDSLQLKKIIDRGKILEPLLLGKKAPNVILPDTTARVLKSLHDVKANLTILFFWEPGCSHCQKEAPKLKALYDKYKKEGVEVFAVDIEANMEEWKGFIKKHSLNWINTANLFKHYYFREMYDIYSTPVIYLLDRDKIIRAKRLNVDQLEGFIKHLLKEDKK